VGADDVSNTMIDGDTPMHIVVAEVVDGKCASKHSRGTYSSMVPGADASGGWCDASESTRSPPSNRSNSLRSPGLTRYASKPAAKHASRMSAPA
jgi:hypothetical protein